MFQRKKHILYKLYTIKKTLSCALLEFLQALIKNNNNKKNVVFFIACLSLILNNS